MSHREPRVIQKGTDIGVDRKLGFQLCLRFLRRRGNDFLEEICQPATFAKVFEGNATLFPTLQAQWPIGELGKLRQRHCGTQYAVGQSVEIDG